MITRGDDTTGGSLPAPSEEGEALADLAPGGLMRALVPMLVVDLTIPLVIFQVARGQGASDTVAYLLAGLGPLLGIAAHVARTRRMDVVSAIFLAMYLLSAAIAAVPGAAPTLLLLKDCAISAVLGAGFLATLLPSGPRPVIYYFGRRFGTDGTEQDLQRWERRWLTLPPFRALVCRLTAMWGLGFLAEAVIKVATTETLRFETAYVVNQVVPFVLVVGLVLVTVAQVRQAQAGPG